MDLTEAGCDCTRDGVVHYQMKMNPYKGITDSLNTPVLFLIFNRPETTQQVFDTIRAAAPEDLYIVGDGPRKDHPEDILHCRQAREIATKVDWDCRIHTLFREENLGCGNAVSSAINWFFAHVPCGIILEDDCIPDPSFFGFCQSLLQYYEDNNRVMMISGTNFLENQPGSNTSYYFSRYYPLWGWASWQRAWRLYDREMVRWPEFRTSSHLSSIFHDEQIVQFLDEMYQACYEKKIDTWDIQWSFTCLLHHGLCAIPGVNLISNIGFTGAHANGKRSKQHNLPRISLDTQRLVHPIDVLPASTIERKLIRSIIPRLSFRERGYNNLKRIAGKFLS